MVEESLLTPEVLALTGRTGPVAHVTVTRKAVHRAMDVFLGHHDREFAPGDPVPGYTMVALDPDSERFEVPDLMPDSLLISDEWSFERALRMGDELTLESRIADISERFGGRFGYSLYVRMEVVMRDSAGDVVCRSGRTMMYYDAANARDGGEE